MSEVYFLRPIGMDGPVKIGVSKSAGDRLAIYQTWSPFPLEEVARIPGGHDTEHRLHSLFAHLRSHHEWFRADPLLSTVIDVAKAGRFDPSLLPPARSLRRVRIDRTADLIAEDSLDEMLNALSAAGVNVPHRIRVSLNGGHDWKAPGWPRVPRNLGVVRQFISSHPCPIAAAVWRATLGAAVRSEAA